MKPKLFDKFGNSVRHNIPMPSEKLLDGGSVVSLEKRKRIIDIAAKFVDSNAFLILGRPSMCQQFSILVKHMLLKEGVYSDVKTGIATYVGNGEEYSWEHFWVETDNGEIIDCNVDSMPYHIDVPEGIEPYNYWGNGDSIPSDRTFTESKIFTSVEIEQLEQEDNETALWKTAIDSEY